MDLSREQIRSKEQLPMILGADEISLILGVSRAKAYQLFRKKDFPTIKIDRRLLVSRDQFFAWLDSQSQGQK